MAVVLLSLLVLLLVLVCMLTFISQVDAPKGRVSTQGGHPKFVIKPHGIGH